MARKPISVGIAESVDPKTGESTPIEGANLWLMPAAPGTCEQCAVAHEAELPHNQQSMFYQMQFKARKGRYPTWTDAMAHCSEEVRSTWTKLLIEQCQKNGLEIPADLKNTF